MKRNGPKQEGHKVDLHIHSCFSGDTDSEPEEMVLRAIELELSGIAFTEHYSYEASGHVEGLRKKYGNSIMIFRGVEFSCKEGHCLVFGVDTDKLLLKNAPVRELILAVGARGGVVIPSHPYRGLNSLGDLISAASGICAVEGCNGANMHAFNLRAIETAKALGLPFTGGSDAHSVREVGFCYTKFYETVTYGNFIHLLKKGNYSGVDTRKISRCAG